ncbi:MAG: hypothetical protein AAGJ46_05920 [Planctomycetota bacterium]
MHARELIEVAATLCLDAGRLIDESPKLCQATLAEYWAASRCRLDDWGRQLSALANHGRSTQLADVDANALSTDLLLTQVHTRCVAAIAVAHDRRIGEDDAGPIARNTLAGHDEAIGRLEAIYKARQRPRSPAATSFRLLARRAERWTDLLLGYVLPLCGSPGATSPAGHAIEFTFDPARAQEFAYDAHCQTGEGGRWTPAVSRVLHAAIHQAFTPTTGGEPVAAPAGDLNRRVAGASLGLFGPEAFDAHGLLRTAWLHRLEQTADDTVGMVEDLFAEEQRSFRPPARWTQ